MKSHKQKVRKPIETANIASIAQFWMSLSSSSSAWSSSIFLPTLELCFLAVFLLQLYKQFTQHKTVEMKTFYQPSQSWCGRHSVDTTWKVEKIYRFQHRLWREMLSLVNLTFAIYRIATECVRPKNVNLCVPESLAIFFQFTDNDQRLFSDFSARLSDNCVMLCVSKTN